nr:MAG TPA_asm: hypothetical protein [Caudoviricetes sp.]
MLIVVSGLKAITIRSVIIPTSLRTDRKTLYLIVMKRS